VLSTFRTTRFSSRVRRGPWASDGVRSVTRGLLRYACYPCLYGETEPPSRPPCQHWDPDTQALSGGHYDHLEQTASGLITKLGIVIFRLTQVSKLPLFLNAWNSSPFLTLSGSPAALPRLRSAYYACRQDLSMVSPESRCSLLAKGQNRQNLRVIQGTWCLVYN